MGTNRLEAFSDGVIAIIVTIMVLELKLPPDGRPESLVRVAPTMLSYALSFVVVAIMWVNHHQLLHAARRADGRLLWSNNFLLFAMSLIPFATAYLGQHYTEPLPAALYGAVMTLSGLGFTVLRTAIAHNQDHDRALLVLASQSKNWLSVSLYALSVPLAYSSVWLSFGIFVLIPLMYFMPESLR
ncbi:MAG TPA: TMEM175 family protein [Bryobacteraceae bacterium]|jgi:uncharacterized membrane protein